MRDTGFLKNISNWVNGKGKPIITVNGNANTVSNGVVIPSSESHTSDIMEVLDRSIKLDIRWINTPFSLGIRPTVEIEYVNKDGHPVHTKDIADNPTEIVHDAYSTWSYFLNLKHKTFRVKIINNNDDRSITLRAINASSEGRNNNTKELLTGFQLNAEESITTSVVETPNSSFKLIFDTNFLGRDDYSVDIDYVTRRGRVIRTEAEINTAKESIDGTWWHFYEVNSAPSKFIRLTIKSNVGSDRTIRSVQIVSSDRQNIVNEGDGSGVGRNIFIEGESSYTSRPFILSSNSFLVNIAYHYGDYPNITLDIEYLTEGGHVLDILSDVHIDRVRKLSGSRETWVHCEENIPSNRVRFRLNNNANSTAKIYDLHIIAKRKSKIRSNLKDSVQYKPKYPIGNFLTELPTNSNIQVSDIDEEYVYGFEGSKIFRSNDALETIEEGFGISTIETGWNIRGFFKTHHGYCIVADKGGNGSIWFSESFNSGFEKVKLYTENDTDYFESPAKFGSLAMHFDNQSALNDVCMVGEYTDQLGQRVFLSKDGGRTWNKSLEVETVNPNDSHHCHVVLHDGRRGLSWAIWGDHSDNRSIWVSYDAGDSWEEFSPKNNTDESVKELQATMMIPTYYGYLMAPDAEQAPGLYGLRERQVAVEDYSRIEKQEDFFFDLTEEYMLHKAIVNAGFYYPSFAVNHHDQIYVLFSTDLNNNKNRVSIIASGDGGTTFHQIHHYQSGSQSAQFRTGIYGIDKDNYLYFQAIVEGEKKTVRAKAIGWKE